MRSDLLQLMKNRRSVRRYCRDAVPLEKIFQVLEAGRHAPSGANSQPWIYVVVTDRELKAKIRKEAEKIETHTHKTAPANFKRWLEEQKITPEKKFLTEAPAIIVVAGLTKAPLWLESTWLSIAYVLLSAESQNLCTLTYTPREKAFLNKLLNIPDEYLPVAILPIGHPAERPSPETRPRKTLKQTVFMNRYDY